MLIKEMNFEDVDEAAPRKKAGSGAGDPVLYKMLIDERKLISKANWYSRASVNSNISKSFNYFTAHIGASKGVVNHSDLNALRSLLFK